MRDILVRVHVLSRYRLGLRNNRCMRFHGASARALDSLDIGGVYGNRPRSARQCLHLRDNLLHSRGLICFRTRFVAL